MLGTPCGSFLPHATSPRRVQRSARRLVKMAWRKLNIPRTDKALIITVISKKREEILKRRLYKELTEELAKSISIAPSDVVVGIIENSVADWSFGNGEPQFLTGALG
jgi:hypothetical protein